MRLPQPPILCITDRLQASRPLQEIAAALHAAGCRWFSVREKDLPAEDVPELVRRIRIVAESARITVHGSAELAVSCRADGVHLDASGNAEKARQALGLAKLIGQSVHSVAEARAAPAGQLDYLIAGPAFPTASKPGYRPALQAEGLEAICRATPLPVLALGGVEPGNIASCLVAGCAGVAIMGGAMRAREPGALFSALLAARDSGAPSQAPDAPL